MKRCGQEYMETRRYGNWKYGNRKVWGQENIGSWWYTNYPKLCYRQFKLFYWCPCLCLICQMYTQQRQSSSSRVFLIDVWTCLDMSVLMTQNEFFQLMSHFCRSQVTLPPAKLYPIVDTRLSYSILQKTQDCPIVSYRRHKIVSLCLCLLCDTPRLVTDPPTIV